LSVGEVVHDGDVHVSHPTPVRDENGVLKRGQDRREDGREGLDCFTGFCAPGVGIGIRQVEFMGVVADPGHGFDA
jgi:hypothetical protein